MLHFVTTSDVQKKLADYLRAKRKSLKYSRNKLAERSTVPAATIKHFETTGRISLRQFLLIWQTIDDLSKIDALTRQNKEPNYKTIEDVLKDA
ncbi:XRE family transcriptional regulator [Cysteiniphilum halobium]|uniref:XRE family transcriptional regulator n=1 Tax=Cysteiniphilum halobium TaxID=2219059 RepID=UPI003F8571D8